MAEVRTAAEPYQGDNEYFDDLLELVSLYLLAGLMFTEEDDDEDEEDDGGALLLAGACMDAPAAARYLLDYPLSRAGALPALMELVGERERETAARLRATEFAPRFVWLRRKLRLPDFAWFCAALALAVSLDRGFERVVAALHGDKGSPWPTLGLARSLYELARPVPQPELLELLSSDSTVSRLLFRPAPEGTPFARRPLALREQAEAYLLGGDGTGALARRGCRVIRSGAQGGDALFLEERAEKVCAAVKRMMAREGNLLLVLCGADGSGRRTALRLAARQAGAGFLLVPADEMGEESAGWSDSIAFCALIHGLIPCFVLKGRQEEYGPVQRALGALERFHVGAALLVNEQRAVLPPQGRTVVRVDFPLPDVQQSLALWRRFGEELGVQADFEGMAAKYTLTPGRIRSALIAARQTADGAATDADIDAAVLAGNTGRLGEIADRIDARYTWDDLVLGDAALGLLRGVCSRIRNRRIVENEWGMGGIYRGGVSVLLYGPPGTGKTMSAQVLARELGLPLYRINLAQVISKYIGETAKNLDAVFAEAKSSNVVLFFDEADALFARRTEVKNSNDRHANSESAYLLQKIEEYHGVSILATNLASNFDEAFRRRIRYMINIGLPDEGQRMRLWEKALPRRLLAGDVDYALLARELEFSGSVIVSAAAQAVYFAAEERGKVSMRHVVRAVQLELQKLGKTVPQSFAVMMAKHIGVPECGCVT